MSFQTLLMLAGGLVALLAGAEGLVRGSSRLAVRVGISPLVIGLTVVALGTSAPEIAISVGAALQDQPDIAVGNVIGSNAFNILFILGLSALITPLVVQQQLVRMDVPLLIAVSLAVWLMSLDGALGRIDGIVLVTVLVVYIVTLIRICKGESNKDVKAEYEQQYGERRSAQGHWAVNVLMVLGGLALLVVGARWLVDSATELARAFGVSELVISLTIVAAGTSLPEVATSVLAAVRGERDIAVGNVIGSCLFNLMAVLGAAALISTDGLGVKEGVREFDLPVMIAVAVACLPVFFSGQCIERWEGALFFAYYIFYMVWLFLNATQHDFMSNYLDAMLYFVVPLTAVTLVVVSVREWKRR